MRSLSSWPAPQPLLALITFLTLSALPGVAGAQVNEGADPSRILNPETELGRLVPFLRSRGGELVDKVYVRRNLSAPDLFTHRFELSDERCVLIVGISSNGADLNLSFLSPRGRVVASDMRPDSHPSVRLCPSERGPHLARFQINAGSGDVYFALFRIPAAYRAELSSDFWQERDPATTGGKATLDRATRQRAEALGRELDKEGFSSIGEAQGVTFTANQTRDFRLNLRSDRCYVFASFAGRGVQDTHASILGPDEVELVSDPDMRRDSIVRFCPIDEDQLILRARLLKGAGPIFIAGWQTKPAELAASGSSAPTSSAPSSSASSSTSSEPSPPAASSRAPQGSGIIDEHPSAGAGLDESFATRRADLLARGYQGGDPIAGGSLSEGESRDYEFTVKGERCYAVLAAGSQSVARLIVSARDTAGGILDRDLEGSQSAIVRFCPTRDEVIRVSAALSRGSGELMLGLFTWPRGIRGPFGLEGVLYLRLAEMIQLLDLESYEPSLLLESSIRALDREGQRARHRVRLEAGSCYALVAVGDEFISDLELALFDGDERIEGDISRSAFPSIRHCPDETRELSFEVGARRGRGKYFYQLFVRRP